MTISVDLQDLLPPIYGLAVAELTGKPLLDIERESIGFALVNSVRWATIRGYHRRDEGAGKRLTTSDRFCTPSMPRHEIANRIRLSSGLDWQLSHLALSLIELRIEISSVDDDIFVPGLGRFHRPKTSGGRSSSFYPYWDLDDSLSRRSSTSNSRDFMFFVERLVTFRRPESWQIDLDKFLVYPSQLPPVETDKFRKHQEFVWKDDGLKAWLQRIWRRLSSRLVSRTRSRSDMDARL